MDSPSAAEAATAIAARVPEVRPRVGLILGSGLGAIAEGIAGATAIPYAEIPGFPRSSVAGHAGQLVLGRLAGVPVACMQGRVHLYEGQPPAAIRTPVRTLKRLGCEILVITNAAGGIRADLRGGGLMLLGDHINLQGTNPLVGPNDDEVGPRFPGLTEAYDAELRGRLRAAAAALGIALPEGVYAAWLGPSLETPAEIRALAVLGADAVGMSTVPEAIVARHCGLRVAAVSVITNPAAGLGTVEHTHEATLEMGRRFAGDLARLLAAFLEGLVR